MRPKLLLIDDDDDVRQTLKEGLEVLGQLGVLCAATGAEGKDLLLRCPINLLVADIAVPGISGFHLARQAASQGVPTLLMSGRPELQHICFICDYPHLHKPFLPSHLVAAVLDILGDPQNNVTRVKESSAKLVSTLQRMEEISTYSWRLGNRTRLQT